MATSLPVAHVLNELCSDGAWWPELERLGGGKVVVTPGGVVRSFSPPTTAGAGALAGKGDDVVTVVGVAAAATKAVPTGNDVVTPLPFVVAYASSTLDGGDGVEGVMERASTGCAWQWIQAMARLCFHLGALLSSGDGSADHPVPVAELQAIVHRLMAATPSVAAVPWTVLPDLAPVLHTLEAAMASTTTVPMASARWAAVTTDLVFCETALMALSGHGGEAVPRLRRWAGAAAKLADGYEKDAGGGEGNGWLRLADLCRDWGVVMQVGCALQRHEAGVITVPPGATVTLHDDLRAVIKHSDGMLSLVRAAAVAAMEPANRGGVDGGGPAPATWSFAGPGHSDGGGDGTDRAPPLSPTLDLPRIKSSLSRTLSRTSTAAAMDALGASGSAAISRTGSAVRRVASGGGVRTGTGGSRVPSHAGTSSGEVAEVVGPTAVPSALARENTIPVHTCPACYEDTGDNVCVKFSPCGHVLCRPCAIRNVRATLLPGALSVPCPTCADEAKSAPAPTVVAGAGDGAPARMVVAAPTVGEMTEAYFVRLMRWSRREGVGLPPNVRPLTEEDLKRFISATVANAILKAGTGDTVKRCHNPACGTCFVVPACSGATAVACPTCSAAVCSMCDRVWDGVHAGRTCEQARTADRASILDRLFRDKQETTFKLCPCCNAGVSKYHQHGCHHVSCLCGTTFCYRCLWPDVYEANASDDYHDESCQQFCDDDCDCPSCPTCLAGAYCDMCEGGCRACVQRDREGSHVEDVAFDATTAALLATLRTADVEGKVEVDDAARALGHAGVWREAGGDYFCSFPGMEDGHLCTHARVIVTAPHYTCCGVTQRGDKCNAEWLDALQHKGLTTVHRVVEPPPAPVHAPAVGAVFTAVTPTGVPAMLMPGHTVTLKRSPVGDDGRVLKRVGNVGLITTHTITARDNVYTVRGPGGVHSTYAPWELQWIPTPAIMVTDGRAAGGAGAPSRATA